MRRRGIAFIECAAFVCALMILMPLLGRLGTETFRSLEAPDRVLRLRQLAATCDRLRRDADAGAWSLRGDELLIGESRWGTDAQGILRDGALHLGDAALSWQQRADGWLVLRVDPVDGSQRVLCLAPSEGGP